MIFLRTYEWKVEKILDLRVVYFIVNEYVEKKNVFKEWETNES